MTATAFLPEFDSTTDRSAGPRLRLIHGDGHDVGEVSGLRPMVEVYRRRRFVVALGLTIAVLAMAHLAGVSLTSFGSVTSVDDSATPTVHVVKPGDTYGGIAAALGVEHPQSFAADLRHANGGGELVVGNRLVVDLDALVAAR